MQAEHSDKVPEEVECDFELKALITYLVQRIIQAIPSVVTFSAAQIKSPSFSLLSSSMTTTNSPRAIASIASGIGSKANGEGGVVAGSDTRVGNDILAWFDARLCCGMYNVVER
jgi:hypothetical protein